MKAHQRQAPITVLIASGDKDDYVQIRDLLGGLTFTDNQYEVSWQADCTDADKALEDNDICLVGSRLVSCTGLEFIGDRATTEATPPMIQLAGGAGQARADLAKEAGADDCLDTDELTSRLLDKAIALAIERKNFRRKLEQLAEFDALTELQNRNAFKSRLEEALASAERTGKHVAVLFIVLDNFKDVNDTLGHPAGDKLLCTVAARLRKIKRKTDIVARMGGDEFALLAVNLERASAATPLARRVLDGLSAPFEIDGKVIHSGASIGVTTFPTDARNAKALLVNADLALYRAKSDGRRGYFFFDAEMQRNVRRRTRLEADLRRAVNNGDLAVHFQPQIDLRERSVSGAEALVRWEHPELGMVSPAAFIPIAETTGLIGPIGDQVLRKACAACAEWSRHLGLEMRVSVNLSPNQFQAEDLSEGVLRAVEESGINPYQLELEITEETMMRNVERAITDLHTLRESGIRLAIDDFGTGYSSLNYLKRFPVHHLKIDRSFVAGVDQNRADRAIVASVIGMGHALGMEVVAEGVERETQLAFLQSQSSNEVQGFLFSPALENTAFQEWVRKFNLTLTNADETAIVDDDTGETNPAIILLRQDPGLPKRRHRRQG